MCLPFDYCFKPPYGQLTPGRLVSYVRDNPFSPLPSLSVDLEQGRWGGGDYQCPHHYLLQRPEESRRSFLFRKREVSHDPYLSEISLVGKRDTCLGCRRMLYYHCCIGELHFRCQCFGAKSDAFYSTCQVDWTGDFAKERSFLECVFRFTV